MDRPHLSNNGMRPMPAAPVERPVAKRQNWLRRHWWQTLLGAVVAVGVGLLAYGYISTRNELSQLSSGKGQGEVKQLTTQIGRYMQLPDETPTLATVNDAGKLKGQEFFKNAQNGDKVLIFSTSGRALLYRPSTKKVIEYSRVDLNTQ